MPEIEAPEPAIEPYGEYVLIHKALPDRSGRIIIPDRYQEKADRGTVLAVGSGRRTAEGHIEPPACQPGDTVAFNRLHGHDFKLWDESVLLIRESDLLAIL